jgi:hypothetical protein
MVMASQAAENCQLRLPEDLSRHVSLVVVSRIPRNLHHG